MITYQGEMCIELEPGETLDHRVIDAAIAMRYEEEKYSRIGARTVLIYDADDNEIAAFGYLGFEDRRQKPPEPAEPPQAAA